MRSTLVINVTLMKERQLSVFVFRNISTQNAVIVILFSNFKKNAYKYFTFFFFLNEHFWQRCTQGHDCHTKLLIRR